MRSRKLLALLFCLITFPAIAGYMTLLGAGVGSIAPVVSWVSGTDAFPSSSLTYSGPSLSTMSDSTGKLTYKPNNLALNTATLSTQTVTVQVGVNYILSIKGTGSVTLSGASTAGPLNGTGASNRVDLKITAATSSLTLTVSGSVTSARLSAVTYETAFRSGDDVDTTASAYYGPRIDYYPNTLAVKGLLIEEARTNQNKSSADIAGTGWTAGAGVTIGATTTAPDGTSRAKLYQSTGASDGLYNTSAVAIASPFASSVYLKYGGSGRWFVIRSYGTGGAQLWVDLLNVVIGTSSNYSGIGTVITPTITAINNGWYRLTLGTSAGATHNYLQINSVNADNSTTQTNGSAYVWGAQTEAGSFATSYIPTAAASVARAADVFQFTGPALTALQGVAGTFIAESISQSGSSPASITNIVGGTNSILYRDTTGKTGTTNGTSALLTTAAPTWNASLRNGLAWSASGRSLAYTSGTVATDANTVSNGGTLYLGSNNGSAVENGWYKSFGIWNQRLSDATLQTKLTVGGSYAANDNSLRFADNDNLPIHWRVAL